MLHAPICFMGPRMRHSQECQISNLSDRSSPVLRAPCGWTGQEVVAYQTLLYRPIGDLLGFQNFGPYENHITFPCVHPLRGPVLESYRYCVRFTSDPKSGLHVGPPWTAIYLAVIYGVHVYRFRVYVKLAVV